LKVLIVALDAHIRDSLVAQFQSRDREYDCVGLEWIDELLGNNTLPALPTNIGLVVNGLSLECLELKTEETILDHLQSLATVCQQYAIPLLHLSNSQVFDGLGDGPRKEIDDAAAVSEVGDLLCQMESKVRQICTQYIILRTGPIFSSIGDNLMTHLLRQFKHDETLELSNVGKSCPISSIDLARVISAMTDQLSCGSDAWGTYHYSSSDPASSYHFAETVLAVASQYMEIFDRPLGLTAVEMDDASWTRPLLNCNVILNTFGIKQLPWRAFIVPTVKNYFEQELSNISEVGEK